MLFLICFVYVFMFYIVLLLFHFYGLNCAILFVNPHRGLFFVVGRSQRCEAPARPVYVFQYMWHPRRAVRLCAFVPDPHPAGVVGGGWGCSAQASSLRLRLHYDTCLQFGTHTLRACFTDNARCVPSHQLLTPNSTLLTETAPLFQSNDR